MSSKSVSRVVTALALKTKLDHSSVFLSRRLCVRSGCQREVQAAERSRPVGLQQHRADSRGQVWQHGQDEGVRTDQPSRASLRGSASAASKLFEMPMSQFHLCPAITRAAPSLKAKIKDIKSDVEKNDLASLQKNLDKKWLACFRDEQGKTSLHLAIEKGYFEMSLFLLDKCPILTKIGDCVSPLLQTKICSSKRNFSQLISSNSLATMRQTTLDK